MSVTVSGIKPTFYGENWFLIDKTGNFSVDNSVMATIWLVGGGMDGGDGFTDTGGFYHGGTGGQGGNVYRFGKVKLKKDREYPVVVGDVNEPTATSIEWGTTLLSSGQMGCTRSLGGEGGIINPNGGVAAPAFGKDGVETPYGYVGSSGGGGLCAFTAGKIVKTTEMSKGGVGAGNSRRYFANGIDWNDLKNSNPAVDAVNYGCGGGGNTYCVGLDDIGVKSRGMPGCVIVQYEVTEDNEDAPNCSVHYRKKSRTSG